MNGRDFSDKASCERFWHEHVSRWETSGQSIVGYCLQHGINEKTFHNWKSKFIRRGVQASQPEGTHTFVEVQMPFRAEASVEVSIFARYFLGKRDIVGRVGHAAGRY